jgi:hypothetical protein
MPVSSRGGEAGMAISPAIFNGSLGMAARFGTLA